nr:MAG: hypothetical protein 2 [Triatovirus sp.]
MLIPSDIVRRPMVRNKLDGFTSFKATAVIKVMTNSHPFQCGRLLIAAAPVPSLLGARKDFLFCHVGNAQNIQHVQMDINKDTEVILKVPFISPYNCYDLIDGKFDWGELQILVYSPLNSVASTCIRLNVYAHLEDIQLGAPTSGEVLIQQSAGPAAVDSARKRESTGRLTGALASLGNGLVSRSLKAVSPLLSAGDAILSAAGWSKPILSKPSCVVLNRPEEGFAYMDGVDQSLVLAMTAGNAVENIPNLVGVGIDETDFHRLKRIPQFVSVFRYSNNIENIPNCSPSGGIGDNVPQLLWSCAVSPSCYLPACMNITPPATGGVVNPYPLNWKQPTTLNYITSPFLYWTGSLVYTFKFVKTDYHSGRVEISFHPFVNNLAPGTTPDTEWLNNRMDYVYRAVVDLRKNSEISVTVPYIAAQPWKRVSTYLDPMNPNPPAPGRVKDICTGMLAVRALTPLFNTETVPGTIEVLVEMRAGDDFEVQGPVTSKFLPFSFGNVDFPPLTQQSYEESLVEQGVADFRVPASIGRIYANWFLNNDAPQFRAQMVGLSSYPLVHLNISASVAKQTNQVVANIRSFLIIPTWEDTPPVGTETYRMGFMFWSDTYQIEQDIIIPNPDNKDTLYLFFRKDTPSTNINPNFWIAINCCAYGRPLAETVTIDPAQLPLPVTGGGGSGDIVKIDPTTLPLPVKVEQPDGPVSVNIEEQPIEVKIDESQLPLPTANQGGSGETLVRLVADQVPLHTNVEQPVQIVAQNPIQVELLAEQFPLTVITQDPVNVKIDSSQIPLPVSGSGGPGPGPGNTVTINPDQLPLWVSDYNVAPMDPRAPTALVEQSGSSSDKLATSGVTETRTRALEGWMPPSITGNEIDAHRPSTTQWCAGEKFTSFRQYSRRFAFCLVSGLDSSRMFKIQPVELVRPGILSLRITPGTQPGNDRTQYALYAPNTRAEVSGSPLSFVAGMYAFYRGSTRFKVWMDPRENPPNLISGHLEYARQDGDVNIIDDNIENFMTPIMYETPLQKQIAEFQVPYYSPTVVSSTWSHGVDSQFDIPLCNLVLSVPDFRQNTANFPIKVAAAAGDDMDFHQFIGPPPVINVGDLLVVGRQLHYPPTGFTPTQKVPLDTARTEESASRFDRVRWNMFTVTGNTSHGPCPIPATYTNQVRRIRQIIPPPEKDSYDEVDLKKDLRHKRSIHDDCYDNYYQNCDPSSFILD